MPNRNQCRFKSIASVNYVFTGKVLLATAPFKMDRSFTLHDGRSIMGRSNFIVNTLRPRQDGCHFADDTLERIFLNGNVVISIKISLKFAPKGPINNIPALVQIVAWRRPGDKILSEAMMVISLTHICVIRPQWVKTVVSTQWICRRFPFTALFFSQLAPFEPF